MPTLRLLPAGSAPPGPIGELLCCAYTPDGAFVVSGGWDGHLRLWESTQGAHIAAFSVTDKQVSACTVSPDNKSLVSGSIVGMLAMWDTVTHLPKTNFLAHTRPISAIRYAPDGKTIATAAWDNTACIWMALRTHDARILNGHKDIVAGCQFTPDGTKLLTWSYDASVRLWEVSTGRELGELQGHTDRVLGGSISPDGAWAVTGARGGVLKLWDLTSGTEAATVTLRGAVQSCHFLRDGQGVVAVDANGRLTLHAVPSLQARGELISRGPVAYADLSPAGNQLALAGTDGRVTFVGIEGFDQAPLLVGATRTPRRTATFMQRLFGRSTLIYTYHCTCPVCRQPTDIDDGKAGQVVNCSKCKRKLKLTGIVRTVAEVRQ